MVWLNSKRIRFVVFGIVAVMVFGGQSAIADFVICDPMPVDEAINRPGTWDVQGCSFLHNGLKLYFSSKLPGNIQDSSKREIWVAERESQDGPWDEAVNLGANINGPGGRKEYPTISPDDLQLYFWGHGGWQSTRSSTDEPWGPATPYTGIYPDDFSPDGLTKYTCAELEGGYGGYDIWVTKRATTDDDWGEPVNLGPNVNSSADQFGPSISNDGRALFFYTGSHRIWMTVRSTTEDEWGPAIQLGPAVNGYGWVIEPEISPDGSTLYFDSGPREGFSERFWQVSITPVVDFNGDGIVDSADMCVMVDHWGEDYTLCDIGPMPWGDGIVDVQDLIVLAEHLFEDDRLVAHWGLDETEGDIAYDSTNEYDGTLHGEPVWQPDGGIVAGALQLDGVDDYVSTMFVLNPADVPFSVTTWIKGGAPGQVIVSQADTVVDTPVGPIITPGSAWLGTTSSEGGLMTGLGGTHFGPLLSESVITDGQWHHIALVYARTTMKRHLYVDGAEVAADSSYAVGESCDTGLYIGAGGDLNASTFFSGLIDDVRLYNATLSAEEIADLAQ